jgi:small subunit ribosomal protein S17
MKTMKESKIKSEMPKVVSRQRKLGKVMSTQMNSTIVVAVDSFITHPLYDKKIRRTRRFLVHDQGNKAKLGDSVTIEESRPISKLKRWILISIDKVADNMPAIDEVDQDNEVSPKI